MADVNQIKIREIFSILTQGIEVLQYEVDRVSRKSTVQGRIFWIDSDIYRLCVDTYRPTIADRVKGVIPPGVYLRDISEIRSGMDCYHFLHHSKPPIEPTHCLSIVASERTISVEFPSKFTRDWFYERFILIANDIISVPEQQARRFRVMNRPDFALMNQQNFMVASRDDLERFKVLLDRGFEVKQHDRSTGQISKAVLSFHSISNSFVLRPVKISMLKGLFRVEPLKISLDDVSEIRPGSHSFGFVRTGSTDLDDQTFSIVGSECVYELQVINSKARDLIVERLFQFMVQFSSLLSNNRMTDPHNASSFYNLNNGSGKQTGSGVFPDRLDDIMVEVEP